MFRSIVLLIGAIVSLSAVQLFAQDAILGQKIGFGVHAYFSGDYLQAHDQLTAAINGGSKDPRAFYFRGLCYLRLGRPQEAVQDFRAGANRESRDPNRFYNVSKSLERVQGADRMELESYRVEARMAALEEAERARKARYEAIQREEQRVLREQPLAAPETDKAVESAAEPKAKPEEAAVQDDVFAAPPEKPAAKPADDDDMFAVPETTKSAPAKKPAKQPAAADEDEPAAEDEDQAAADDMFKQADEEKEPVEAEEEEKPAEKPAAKSGGLMGAMGKALGKAGGGAKKPAKDEPADEAANPFLEEAAADNAEAADEQDAAETDKKDATDEKPAAETDDADEAKPENESADDEATDDPFAQ